MVEAIGLDKWVPIASIDRRVTQASRETIARVAVAIRNTIAKIGTVPVRASPQEVTKARTQKCICRRDWVEYAVGGVAVGSHLCLRLKNLGFLKVLEVLEKKY